MADIHDLDIEHVKLLLSKNNIKIPRTNEEIYDIAFELMNNKSTLYDDMPVSIIEWMMAYNLLNKNLIIDFYSIEDIKELTLIDRKKLAKSLGMKGDNIDNIVNILRYIHKLKSEIPLKLKEDLPIYAVYSIRGVKKILMLLKPRTHEVTYTPWGVKALKLNQNKLFSYQTITNIVARSKDLIVVPYIKGRSESEIEQLILADINQPKYEIKDIIHTDLPIYSGRYGDPASPIKVLKSLLSCQKVQYTTLVQSPKDSDVYNTIKILVDKNDFVMMGKNNNYIIISTDIVFEDILHDIQKCGKVYYMIGTSKHLEKMGERVQIGHAMSIIIDPKLKLLEVYDSNGLTFDTKHVYFWVTKLSEYLGKHGIEVHRKINADEPYCPQSWSSFAEEFKGEGQCLVWSYWYTWLRINNFDIPPEYIRKYINEMSPDEVYDRIRRIASIVFEFDENVDVTYAVYSRKGDRKILMLQTPNKEEVIYTPYGLNYLKLDINKLPTYFMSLYMTIDKEEFVSIPYVKGRSSEEIERLINEKINKI